MAAHGARIAHHAARGTTSALHSFYARYIGFTRSLARLLFHAHPLAAGCVRCSVVTTAVLPTARVLASEDTQSSAFALEPIVFFMMLTKGVIVIPRPLMHVLQGMQGPC